MSPQHHPAGGIQDIEVGDPVLPLQALEQGGDLGLQGPQVAGQKGGLEGGVAADRAEGGVELGRVVVELQAEQALHGPHAVGQVVRPGVRLVAIGDGQEGAQRQEEHQGKGDQDRPFDAVGAAHGVSTEGCWDWRGGGGAGRQIQGRDQHSMGHQRYHGGAPPDRLSSLNPRRFSP